MNIVMSPTGVQYIVTLSLHFYNPAIKLLESLKSPLETNHVLSELTRCSLLTWHNCEIIN